VRRIIWSRAAREDLRSIRAYIDQFNPIAAGRVALALIEAADSLTDFPERGRVVGPGRRELTAVWPYVIRYRFDHGGVVIVRIRHGRQAPN
jgi:plasmid stabilization system protein ParE